MGFNDAHYDVNCEINHSYVLYIFFQGYPFTQSDPGFLPACTMALYNSGIIVCVPLLTSLMNMTVSLLLIQFMDWKFISHDIFYTVLDYFCLKTLNKFVATENSLAIVFTVCCISHLDITCKY